MAGRDKKRTRKQGLGGGSVIGSSDNSDYVPDKHKSINSKGRFTFHAMMLQKLEPHSPNSMSFCDLCTV